MSRVVKRRLYIVLAFVLSVIMVIMAMPLSISGSLRAKAVDVEVKAKHLYLDISNFQNKEEWDNKVYLFVDSWGSMNAGTRISNTDVFEWDCSQWGNMDHKFAFLASNSWDTVKKADYRRTEMSDINLSVINSGGKYCYWDGNSTSVIDGKKAFKLSYSDSSNGSGNVPDPQPGMKRIYFDATLSKLTYKGDNTNSEGKSSDIHFTVKDPSRSSIPYENGSVFYFASGDSGNTSGIMNRLDANVWYADIDTSKYTKIRFASKDNIDDPAGDVTHSSTIPQNIENPVFFADSGDASVYNYADNKRSGYWGSLGDIRDAETGKTTSAVKYDVVPVDSGKFEEKSNTLYVNSSIYDYYSDYELNGYNRAAYPLNTNKSGDKSDEYFASHRNWVTFRQFSQALSDYYQTNDVPSNNTIYTGHFQPSVTGWGYPFSDVAGTLGLYGWNDTDKNSFQVNNNSCKSLDDLDNPNKYRYATQGIASSSLINNSDIAMNTTSGNRTEMPFFNDEFLLGQNSKNAKLGEVYHNVAFPFTKVDRDGNGIYYWSFDSAATTLKLRENSNAENNNVYPYYLDTVHMTTIVDAQKNITEASRAGANTNHDRIETEKDSGSDTVWSKNLISSGITNRDDDKNNRHDYPSNKYGYFPLNDISINETDNAGAAKYNYGFGTKLEFDFGLTNQGNIVITNQSGARIEAATTFNFSGDDDVWVFVDGKLVLDIGGDHGRTSGCINFSRDKAYNYSYSYKIDNSSGIKNVTNVVNAGSVLVSEVKKSANRSDSRYSNIGNENVDDEVIANPVQESLWTKLGITNEEEKNEFYNSKHTLTFFYMERGMWESNMRLQFNFPEHDTIEVAKKLDLDTYSVSDIFKSFFDNEKFSFNIQNLVTHYGTQESYVTPGYSINQADIRDYGSAKSGGALKNASGAYYDLKTVNAAGASEEKNKQLGRDGIVELSDDQSAYFSKQFRRGSYIGVEEQLTDSEKELYTTFWTISENEDSNIKAQGEGTRLDDERVETKDSLSGGYINDYNTESNPGAVLFRSYEKPMDAVDVDLKATFTNIVNTGSLVVTKAQAAGSEPINGEYSFRVTFSNIGGKGLAYSGNTNVVQEFRLKVNKEWRLDGIPVGTAFSITEAAPGDGSVFDSVTSSDDTSTVSAAAARTITGVIGYVPRNNSKGEEETVTFTNKKQKEVISITVTKKWENIKGVTLPESVNFQLQRKTGNGQWEAVDNYRGFSLTKNDADATGTVSSDSTATWSKTIENLDKYSTGTTPYYYRILEYSADGSLMKENSMNFSPNYVAVYSNLTGVASTDNAPALTVTNTYSAIVIPETGAAPLFNFAMIGISAVGIAFIALLIYKRKLQTADVNTGERGGLNK